MNERRESIRQRLRGTALLLVLVALLGGCAGYRGLAGFFGGKSCFSHGWPQDQSDLQPDPAIRFGRLENGLRYVIMKNKEPKNRVALQLDVQAGSLDEKDDQRGLAHFLEHMEFNGTTHFPPGTLVKYFQSIGMNFGADTNAHTSYDETVYNLLLPKGDPATLEKGLLVMGDYARGALLLPEEVNRERGVILAEKRTRDSAGYRAYKKRTEFAFAGTKAAVRLPIGVEKVLLTATPENLREFYDTWYTPKNMILVLVGDVDVQAAESLVRDQLASLKAAPDASPECSDFGRITRSGVQVLAVPDAELGYTDLTVESLWNIEPQADTKDWEQQQFLDYVAAAMMNNRLEKEVRTAGSPLTDAEVYSGVFLQRIGYTTMSAKTDRDRWEAALKKMHVMLRQAIEHGFTASELDRAKKELQAQLEKAVQTADGRDSTELVGRFIDKLNNNEVILSPVQERDLYGPMLEKMTLAEVNRRFSKLWDHGNRLVEVAGTANQGLSEAEAAQKVRTVFEESQAVEVAPYQQEKRIAFPYLPIPEQPQAKPAVESLPAIGASRITLANGTVVNLKKTNFKPHEVSLVLNFGYGRLGEPVPGLANLARDVVRESGLGGLTQEELADALAGRNGQVSFDISQESFVLRGQGLDSEIELLFQLVYAYLRDPAFRPEAYRLAMERAVQMYDNLDSSVEGMMMLNGEQFLAGGVARYGFPPKERFKQLTLEQVQQWLQPEFTGASLELNVVGDFDPATVEELANRYLGGLARKAEQEVSYDKATFPEGKSLVEEVDSRFDKALLVVAWPTDDFWDISRSRRLNVLASLLDDRLRREIREKMSATYAPVVYNLSSRVDPGYGVLSARMIAAPAKAKVLLAKMEETILDVRQSGLEPGELQRTIGPIVTSIKDMIRQNDYWMNSVLSLSSRHPQQLEWPLTIVKDFSSITEKEILDLASRYLHREKAATVLIRPASKK